MFGKHSEHSEEEFRRKNRFKQLKFCIFLTSFQLTVLCLYLQFVRYSSRADANIEENGIVSEFGGGAEKAETGHLHMIITFNLVLASVFIGSCYNVSKIKGFEYSGQILQFVQLSLGFQVSILFRGFFLHFLVQQPADEVRIDIHDLTEALLACLALIIVTSYVMGKTSPINILITVVFQVPTYTLVKLVSEEIFLVTDPGSTLSIFLHSSLYGFALHLVALKSKMKETDEKAEIRPFLGLCGSVVFFIMMPVVNGIISESDAEMTRAVINTLLSGTSCFLTSTSFHVAYCHLNSEAMTIQNLQNCFLCGAIAIGPVSTLMIEPFGALCIGGMVGLISSFSYLYVEPRWQRKLKLPDTGRTLSTIGIPALLGGFVAILMAFVSEDGNGIINYHKSLYPIYPGRVSNVSKCSDITCPSMGEIISNYPFLEQKARSRSAFDQALYQSYGLVLILGASLIIGALNGLVLRMSAEKCGNYFPSKVWFQDCVARNQIGLEKSMNGEQLEREMETMICKSLKNSVIPKEDSKQLDELTRGCQQLDDLFK